MASKPTAKLPIEPPAPVPTELDKKLAELQNENMISRDPHILARVKEVLEAFINPKATHDEVMALVKATEAAKKQPEPPKAMSVPAPAKTEIPGPALVKPAEKV